MNTPLVHCPICGHGAPVDAVLDFCSHSWPANGWLESTCRRCGRDRAIAVSESTISIGEFDGAPAPCFIPAFTVDAPGLSVTSAESGVEVVYQGRRWRVPTQRIDAHEL